MAKHIRPFDVIWVVALLLVAYTRVNAAVPFTAIDSRVITVTTAATKVSVLLGSAAVGECFKIANPTSALICLGDSGVDSTATPGDDCWPICSGASCAETVSSIPYSIANTYLRAPVGTTAYLLLGNGC